jgi:hypothetical protein
VLRFLGIRSRRITRFFEFAANVIRRCGSSGSLGPHCL